MISQSYLARWVGIRLGAFSDESDEEFIRAIGGTLIEETALDSERVLSFISNNKVSDLKEVFRQLNERDVEPIGFIDSLLAMKECGINLASHLLSFATDGVHIIYHDDIYDSLIELLPDFKEEVYKVTDGVSYMYFQMFCWTLIETLGFTSVQEVHSFLWHGKNTNWTFKE